MNAPVIRGFVWSGLFLVVVMMVTLPWMGFLPPPPPGDSAETIANHYLDRKLQIQVSSLLECIAFTFWITWGVAIVVFIRKMERGFPVLTFSGLGMVAGGSAFFLMVPMTWAVIAFRPEILDPSVIQIMNYFVWFAFLFTWPPFSAFMIIIAIAIFNDHNVPTLYPRWVAYLSLWCGILLFPAGLIVFFTEGLFAYNGIGAFWIPFVCFFSWMLVMSVFTLRAVSNYQRRPTTSTGREPISA